MPRYCPNCNRAFRNRRAVLAHLSQPAGTCYSPNENIVIAESLSQRRQYCTYDSGSDSEDDSPPSPSTSSSSSPSPSRPPSSTSTPAPPLQDTDAMDIDEGVADMSTQDGDRDGQDVSRSNIRFHSKSGKVFGTGDTFMDCFDADKFSKERKTNLYYPFRDRAEWELASYLLRSNLSMAAIDELLKLERIRGLSLSFKTAKDLRSRIELLPHIAPWKCRTIRTSHPTKKKIELYYRDPTQLLAMLLQNPLVADHIQYTPFKAFTTAACVMRTYGEWLSGDVAHQFRDAIPEPGTLLGVILSSDKTNITTLSGDRSAHPLLISLANIDPIFRSKASNHAFLLLALLPIPKFVEHNKKLRGILESRLNHECLDITLAPLKKAAEIGILIDDAFSLRRRFYTPIAAFIVDTPEAALLSCVGGKTSPFTTAFYKEFGDTTLHAPRTAEYTLQQLRLLETTIDPNNLPAYATASRKLRLNGVHRPFWRDYPLADPSLFLLPEPLHHFHKMFFDHDLQWCINALTPQEIDFRFSILPPHTGYRHFKAGVSTLKQVTGREQRDMQRYIVAVISGAIDANFVIAIRALLEFRYLALAPQLHERNLDKLDYFLNLFHAHRASIIDAGARRSKKKKKTIDNWYIPKLELFLSVVPQTRNSGAVFQHSADVTEHYHITEVKQPASATNQQNYEAQICRYLDRLEKARMFDLATAIREAHLFLTDKPPDNSPPQQVSPSQPASSPSPSSSRAASPEPQAQPVQSTAGILAAINPAAARKLEQASNPRADYFQRATDIEQGRRPTEPKPPRTFAGPYTAIHLTRDATYHQSVDDIVKLFNLPDLPYALSDYLTRIQDRPLPLEIGGRRTITLNEYLPHVKLEVWTRVQIQSKSFFPPHDVQPSCTVNATPPSEDWPHGHYNSILINTDANHSWPYSGLNGHTPVFVKLLFRIVFPGGVIDQFPDNFLMYAERLDFVPQPNPNNPATPDHGVFPEQNTSMYLLHPARRTNGTPFGDVIPLQQARSPINVTPRFPKDADRRFTKANSIHFATELWLNHFFTRDLYYAITHAHL